jgi:hypothetical protein
VRRFAANEILLASRAGSRYDVIGVNALSSRRRANRLLTRETQMTHLTATSPADRGARGRRLAPSGRFGSLIWEIH